VVTAAYVHTRGRERHRDYQFVGPAPPTSWWRAYADHTTFERPTVLVQSDGRGWQLYLSGIPSRRRDAVGTVIRYTVVAEGTPDQPAPDRLGTDGLGTDGLGTDGLGTDGLGTDGPGTRDVLALVANWLADQDLDRDAGQVSAAMDAAFPEPDVERLLAVDPGEPAPADAAEVARRLAGALRGLRLPIPAEPEPMPEAWLADLSRPVARAAFVQRVDALLAGQPGRALVLNLVGTPSDLSTLVDDPRPLVVLAPDLPDPEAIVPLEREPAKKAAPPPGTSHPEPAAPPPPSSPPTPREAIRNLRGCLRLIMVPIALIMALALALVGALLYLR
jgi:hypothetical protein